MQKNKWRGLGITILVAISPAVLWLGFSPSHTDPLIKMAALAALSLLSFNIILSARLPVLESLFFGLDRLYRAHRRIGGTIVMLVLLHSGLLTLKYLHVSPIDAYNFVIPSTDWALLLGKLSLYTMTSLVVLTIYFRIRYQWFVTCMRVLGAVVFLAGYHAVFVKGSDLTLNLPLSIYMLAIGGTAAWLYIYRSFFHGTLKPTYNYQVESVTPKGQITELWLKPLGRPLNRYAGQFAFITLFSNAVDTEPHPFTIAAGSNETRLRFCMKNLGDFTNAMRNVKVGDKASIEGPYGYFSFTKLLSKKQTWVAGGIGITPFLAMAHSLPSNYQVTYTLLLC